MRTLMTSRTRRRGGALVALVLGVTLAGHAQAAPITFEFTGTVSNSGFATIPSGSALTGSYTFDDGLPDTNPDPSIGAYGPVDLTITFADGSSIITSTATIGVFNDWGFSGVDAYGIQMDTAPHTLTGSFVGLAWQGGWLSRTDVTGAAFSDDSLPLTPPVLASFPQDNSTPVAASPFLDVLLTSLTLSTADGDGDGIADVDDNCPEEANADQADTDFDGEGDACDPDIDGDGVPNDDDNCPLDPNPDQADADGDGAGDACDADRDGDGIRDDADLCVPTAPGEMVNADGCSIADLVPCDAPWKNKGAYLAAVAQTAEEFFELGLITAAEKDAIVAAAGKSSCRSKT